MATSTPNYGLKKFENGDPPDLPSLAASMDKIDTELKKNETNIGLLQPVASQEVAVGQPRTVVLDPGLYEIKAHTTSHYDATNSAAEYLISVTTSLNTIMSALRSSNWFSVTASGNTLTITSSAYAWRFAVRKLS